MAILGEKFGFMEQKLKIKTCLKWFLGVWFGIVVFTILILSVLNIFYKDRVENGYAIVAGQKQVNTQEQKFYEYVAKIKFSSPIFRAQKNLSKINIIDLTWDKQVEQKRILNFENPDGMKNILVHTPQILKEHQEIANLTYTTYFLIPKALDYLLIQNFLPQILTICFILFFYKVIKKFNACYPKRQIKHCQIVLHKRDKIFLGGVIAVCLVLFTFQFWLGFPGFHIIGDTYASIALNRTNAHPVFISYILMILYFIFGKHLFYLFLVNLVPFYVGICLLVCGVYLRFRTMWAILLFTPILIGNFYFQNFIQYTSFGLPMLLFCLYSLLLFLILVPCAQKRWVWIVFFVLAFCAILWRHNAIFSVFPAFIVLSYLWIKDRDLPSVGLAYFKTLFYSAILCLSIVILIPQLLRDSIVTPANHAFLHQIAGVCVPEDDSGCFKQEWYYSYKNWEDVKKLYEKYPFNADPFNVPWGYSEERPFKTGELKDLKSKWLESILKYPQNYFLYQIGFFKRMWSISPDWIMDAKSIQRQATQEFHLNLLRDFPKSERSITFSPLREKIYTFLYHHHFSFNYLWIIVLNGILMCISFILICLRRRLILLFCFATSFACFWSAVFISAFTTIVLARYMAPILPLGVLAIIGFVIYLVEIVANKDGSPQIN